MCGCSSVYKRKRMLHVCRPVYVHTFANGPSSPATRCSTQTDARKCTIGLVGVFAGISEMPFTNMRIDQESGCTVLSINLRLNLYEFMK